MILEEDACSRLPEVLSELSLPRTARVVGDENTYEVLGKKAVEILSKSGYDVREIVLHSLSGRMLSASRAAANELLSALPSVPLLIAVGSGTINDLTKCAAHERRIPYVVVPTAPSMNGYTSSIVALMDAGLKTTFEANPPIAVVADLSVLVESPMELITAGLGDIVSKPVSTADWKLSEIVNGDYFCPRPIELVEKFEPQYINNAAEIGLRKPEAIRALMEALLYSGISMIIAGSSSPGSGGEHLISHTIDMKADAAGREHGYHGTQVGVATIFTAALYEKVLNEGIPSFDVEALVARGAARGRQTSQLKRYWGNLAEVVSKELSFKLLDRRPKRKQLVSVQERWDQIRDQLRAFLRPWSEIKSVLRKAGAATRIRDVGLSLEEFREAVLHAREMRRRYTILDLANDFGLLEKHLESIVAETGLSAE
jgi:glycerol-1-phosphate dehydrogenase [NAD(P)+]